MLVIVLSLIVAVTGLVSMKAISIPESQLLKVLPVTVRVVIIHA